MADHVTVYRSMETSAENDARAVHETLTGAGLAAVLLDDSEPGVPEGVWEVQVPAADADRADQILAANPPAARDNSAGLDLVPIFSSGTPVTGNLEALGIKALLEANGITAVSTGDSVQPELPATLSVPREHLERAKQLIAEAQAGGPDAAESAEAESESAQA